jgi:hypothetical protein
VNDVVAVQVAHSADHLSKVEGGEVFLEIVLFTDLFEQAPVGHELQKQVDFIGVVKKSIHLEDVGVVRVQLDLYFLQELRLHSRCPHLCFADHLYGAGEARVYVPAHIYITEFTPSQLAAHFKHVQVQLFVLVRV